jgi:hypothetical protein
MQPGDSASKNFVLVEQIKTINDLVSEIENSKSLFWRHRVHPTSFFLGWPLRTLLITIQGGYFWTVKRKENERA